MVLSADPQLIVLLAAEPSADALGEQLALALRARLPGVRLVGMAGPRMRAVGVESWWSMEEVSVMGLWEVLRHYPRLRRLQREIIARLLREKPDMLVGIDGPDFTLPIEAAIKAASLPAYHYVSPTVWAWRAGRAERMASQTDGVLCLFPFEPPYYLQHELPAQTVGHPLADALPLLPDRTAARAELGLSPQARVLALLPGSRRSEWRYNAPVFFAAAHALRASVPELTVVVPCLNQEMRDHLQAMAGDLPLCWVENARGASKVLTAADAALVASGTATLEAALCHLPMVVAYRMHPLTFWLLRRMVRTPWVALPNIIANRMLVPEYLQQAAQPEALAQALLPLLSSSPARQQQIEAFEQMHASLRQGAATKAASVLLDWWHGR